MSIVIFIIHCKSWYASFLFWNLKFCLYLFEWLDTKINDIKITKYMYEVWYWILWMCTKTVLERCEGWGGLNVGLWCETPSVYPDWKYKQCWKQPQYWAYPSVKGFAKVQWKVISAMGHIGLNFLLLTWESWVHTMEVQDLRFTVLSFSLSMCTHKKAKWCSSSVADSALKSQ